MDGKLEKVEPILSVPKEMLRKHGYSVLSKEIKQDELEGYIQRARLSRQEAEGNEQKRTKSSHFVYMRKVRDIAMEEFRRQASNVKLSDVLAEKKKEPANEEDEFEIL